MSTPSTPSSFTPPRSLPFPPGHYTLLPIIDACDNLSLPSGPWSAADLKHRRDTHSTTKLASKASTTSQTDSALDDDEDDSASSDPASEFLVPFFVSCPKDNSTAPPTPSSAPLSRRSSSARASFSGFTPLPSLRSSSPTFSRPSPADFAPPPPTSASSSRPIGFLRPSIVRALIDDNRQMLAMRSKPVWAFLPPLNLPVPPSRRASYSKSRPLSRRNSNAITPLTPGTPGLPSAQEAGPGSPQAEGTGALRDALEGLSVNGVGVSDQSGEGVYAVGFAEWVNEEGEDSRKEHIDRVVRGWKMDGKFLDQLGGWRDELYTVYGPYEPLSAQGEEGASPLPGSNKAFAMERSACALFGVATFGVHLTAYVDEPGEELKIWVPRRSPTKQTWPGYLDNTVAGGITSGDLPRESVIRECAEEASLPESIVAPLLRSTSVITYNYRNSDGWIQPEVQYIYDLHLPANVVPKPCDGEVATFELMGVEEVVRRMVDGEFKPNCGMVLVDFFLRHGYLNPESDARYLDVTTRLRNTLALPGPA